MYALSFCHPRCAVSSHVGTVGRVRPGESAASLALAPCEDCPVSHVDDRAARVSLGDDVAVRAAFLTVAALSVVDPDWDATRDKPTIVLYVVLSRVLELWKRMFPNDESVQSAELRLVNDDNRRYLVDCHL